jgi:hypothetical protein
VDRYSAALLVVLVVAALCTLIARAVDFAAYTRAQQQREAAFLAEHVQ